MTVQNPAPPTTCFVHGRTGERSWQGEGLNAGFHTAAAGETLLAFVSADGPLGCRPQTATVSGGGLTWTLVKRANGQAGDSEVWEAHRAERALERRRQLHAEPRRVQPGSHRDRDGGSEGDRRLRGDRSGASGAPKLSLTTTAGTSLVFAVGNDWDNAVARTLPSGWTMLDQWINTGGDTYWSQYTNNPTGYAGSVITVSDTAPTNDRWISSGGARG